MTSASVLPEAKRIDIGEVAGAPLVVLFVTVERSLPLLLRPVQNGKDAFYRTGGKSER